MRLYIRRLVTFFTLLFATYFVLSYISKSLSNRRTHGDYFNEDMIRRVMKDEVAVQLELERELENRRDGQLVKREEDLVLPVTEKPRLHDMKEMMVQVFRGENVPDDILAMTPPKYLQNFKNPCWYERDPESEHKGDNPIIVDGVRVKLRCLPYFHLIGVDKSGTTDLWARLGRHPQMAQPTAVMGKETHWWSWRRFGFDIWVRNAPIRHFDWYLQHFDSPAERILKETVTINKTTYHPVITGEGSPTVYWDFTGWDLIPQNKGLQPETVLITPHCIHHFTPKAKLILMLRNPIERMYSEYLFLDHFKAVHNVSAQLFHEGVTQSISMFMKCLEQNSHRNCLYNKTLHMNMPVRVLVGLYSEWLQPWLDVFPANQLLILRYEDYAKDMATTLRDVIDFLGLSKVSEEEMSKIIQLNKTFTRSENNKKVGDMLPATHQVLDDFYWEYSIKLSKMLGDTRYMWHNAPDAQA